MLFKVILLTKQRIHDLTLAKRLKTERQRAGITQAQLAVSLGVTAQYICNVERGACSLAPSKFKRTAEILGIDSMKLVNSVVSDYKKKILCLV